MKRWMGAMAALTLAVSAAGVLVDELVRAQAAPPTLDQLPPASTRNEWELLRMTSLAQEALDHLERREELLGSVPRGMQALMVQARERLQELNQATQQRDIGRARGAFRSAVALLDEIRFQLNEALDAENGLSGTAEQAAARVEQMVVGLRRRHEDLTRLSTQHSVQGFDPELMRIEGLIDALEARAAAEGPASVRDQLAEARQALRGVQTALVARVEESL